ncbi:cysteine desulfurase family protein [Melghirimyces algeriensis]|uniref:cysteine desulfurase n=1 Tax=Melghirimyces algeriensis TaxID=910412 RepID=A0A521CU98_9BACL|nr:cysteine desulfurase family protein [Melghirimyces algeriensis]SMO62993.1 cysteine desulfurase [Melghirimyces algeriensis]
MGIYLDHAATTPIHPEVREKMLPFLDQQFGNPSSIHNFGREIRNAVDRAREQLAYALNVKPGQLTFTSGGTEADNMALTGVALSLREQGKNHVITSQIEHRAVLDTCGFLERLGFRVTYVPVDSTGCVCPDEVMNAVDEQTALISVIYGNNEMGTLQPIEEIGQRAREQGVLFHTDAVQAFGMELLDLEKMPVDLLTVSSHKINGPKGVGALYIRPDAPILPILYGGEQERRRRGGTENVPGIIGFGQAAEIAVRNRGQYSENIRHVRQVMLEELKHANVQFVVNGHPEKHLPHILNLSFPGVETEVLLMNLDMEGIACSSGSACTSGTLEVSHVLKAMHLPEEILHSAIRFSFGLGNTEENVRQAARTVGRVIARLN